MNNINFFSGIVKILENPKHVFFNDKVSFTKVRVELPQFRKHKILYLIFWGKLAEDVRHYYHLNDYIIIEGYLSVKQNYKGLKLTIVTVLKTYPFLLKAV